MIKDQDAATRAQIVDIFSILHDGTIASWTGDRSHLRLTVFCEYLAERINSTYEHFFVELLNINRLAFVPWMNPAELEQEYLIEIKDIFKPNLDILGAESSEDMVKISLNQRNLGYNYCGGFLYLASEGIRVLDQSENEMSIDRLYEICKGYWNDFSNKNK